MTACRNYGYSKVEALTWIRYSAVSDEFSQEDTERPDIGFNGEFTVVGCLGRRPFYGEPCAYTGLVLIFLLTEHHVCRFNGLLFYNAVRYVCVTCQWWKTVVHFDCLVEQYN